MEATMTADSARRWSLLLGASSVLLPAGFHAWQSWKFSRWAEAMDGYVCGLPFLGAMALTVVLAGVLSVIALVVGTEGYMRLPEPRPRLRRVELWLVSIPAVVMLLALLALVGMAR